MTSYKAYIHVIREEEPPIGAQLWKYWIFWQQEVHCDFETSNLYLHSKDFVDAAHMRASC
jgi:hypothetical protein